MLTSQSKPKFSGGEGESFYGLSDVLRRLLVLTGLTIIAILEWMIARRWIYPWISPNSLMIWFLPLILSLAIGLPIAWHRKQRIARKYAGRTLLTINISSEVNDLLEKLAEQLGGDKVEVLRKSIGLMELAMQAHEQGLAVGATKGPESLEIEFTGF